MTYLYLLSLNVQVLAFTKTYIVLIVYHHICMTKYILSVGSSSHVNVSSFNLPHQCDSRINI